MPEWYLSILFLAGLVGLSYSWAPLSVSLPLLALAVGAPLLQAFRSAYTARLERGDSGLSGFGRRAIIAGLHLLQPLARLHGRIAHGLTFWRRRGGPPAKLFLPRVDTLWSESWRSPFDWLSSLEKSLKDSRAVVVRGGDFDRWDLEILGGLFGSVRVLMAVEEHGDGKQLLRFRARPKLSLFEMSMIVIPAVLAGIALIDGAWVAGAAMALASVAMLIWQLGDCSVAMTCYVRTLRQLTRRFSPSSED